MRNLTIFILVLSILYASTKDAVSYVSYIMNMDYIANTLCINRNDDSQPLCKGTCMLKESLENNHENQGEVPLQLTEEITIKYYSPEKGDSFQKSNKIFKKIPIEHLDSVYSFSFNKDLLRPPQLKTKTNNIALPKMG